MLGPDSNLPIELASNAMIQHAGTIMVIIQRNKPNTLTPINIIILGLWGDWVPVR